MAELRDPSAVPRVITVAGIVLLISVVVGGVLGIVGTIPASFADSVVYRAATAVPFIGFIAAAGVILAYEPFNRRRIARFVERPGWSAEKPSDADFEAMRAGAGLSLGRSDDLRHYPESLSVTAYLEREAGSVRVAIPPPRRPRRRPFGPTQPLLSGACVWIDLPVELPEVVVGRRFLISRQVSGIDHGRLDEKFTFDPPGRAGRFTDPGDDPRERAYDTELRAVLGPAADVLVDAPDVFLKLGIVQHRLLALTLVDARSIEATADLLLRLRAALPG